jgi:hypothetical protein
VGAQEPPARRSAGLVAVAAQRAGPPYALPGQAEPSEPWGNGVGHLSIGDYPIKWVRIQPALTTAW